MLNRQILALVAAAGVGAALALGVGLVVGAPDTALPWSVFGSGGSTESSSASYKLGSTAGQTAIGSGTSTGFKLGAGFWYGVCKVGSVDDTDCDATADATETACGSNPGNPASIPERIDGAFAGNDDDGDGPADEALPGGSDTFDCDGDGWPGNQENLIYLDAPSTVRDQDPCGNNGWPGDLAASNTMNIADIGSFLNPARGVLNPPVDAHSAFNRFSHPLDDWGAGGPGGGNPPDGVIDPEMARWNLQTPPHLATTAINIGDLNGLITGAAGSPAGLRSKAIVSSHGSHCSNDRSSAS